MLPLTVLLALPAYAGDAGPAAGQPVANPFEEADESALFRLDEQLVTVASRYAETVRQAPGIVSVVTADQIRERGYRTLSDVLRDLPGIYVWKSPEGRDLASFRGVVSSDNDKILLLVDGVPWYDGVYGHAFVDDYLPIATVRQIEVIKGPGSAIYGTNAFAGVINVVTWSPSDVEGARFRLTAGSGTHGEATAIAGGTRRVGAFETGAVAYARLLGQTGDGLDVTPDGTDNALGEDPKRGVAAGARVDVGPLTVRLQHVDWRHSYLTLDKGDTPAGLLATDLDTSALVYHDTFFDARYDWKLGKSVVLTPNLYSERHDDPGDYWYRTGPTLSDTDGDGVPDDVTDGDVLVATEKDTRRWGAGVDVDARPGLDHHVTAGAGVEEVTVLSLRDTQYDDANPDGAFTGFGIDAAEQDHPRLCNGYAFGQYTWIASPGVELVGGARADKRFACSDGYAPEDEGLAVHVSPRVGVLLVPSDKVTTKLLYGQAFRYPTVREMLVAAPLVDGKYQYTNGNPSLRPESISTAEGELTATVATGVELRGDASWSLVSREINKVDVAEGTEYGNLGGNLGILAAEAEAHLTEGPVQLRLAYSWTHARYAGFDDPYAGRPQYEFPEHMGKGSVRVAFTDHLSATLTGEAYSTRPRSAWSPDAGIADGEPFGLLHLGVRAADLGPQGGTSLDVSVRNLTNATWETGVFRDQADEVHGDGTAKYPLGIEGEERAFYVSVETRL